MHIAICDDNVADRKQCERLMGREVDKWVKDGNPIFTFSFGNAGALLESTMEFAGIILDITQTPELTNELVIEKLRSKGSEAVVVVCSGDAQGEGVLKLPKPIRPEELHEILCKVDELKPKDLSKLEFRNDKGTIYVEPEEIICADKSGLDVILTLTDDRSFNIYGDVDSLFEEVVAKKEIFAMPTANAFINIKHVSKVGFRSVFLDNGKKYRISGSVKKYVLYKMKEE